MTKEIAYMVCLVEGPKNINELFIDEVQISLLVYEHRMKNSYIQEQALKVSINGEYSTQIGSIRDHNQG